MIKSICKDHLDKLDKKVSKLSKMLFNLELSGQEKGELIDELNKLIDSSRYNYKNFIYKNFNKLSLLQFKNEAHKSMSFEDFSYELYSMYDKEINKKRRY